MTKYDYEIDVNNVETETVTYVQGVDDTDPNRLTIDPSDPDDRVVVTTLDEFGRVASVDDSQAGVTAYTYRADGQVLSTTVYEIGVTSTAYRQTTYGYNDFGWLTSIADTVSGTTTFTFDKRGLRTSLEDAADNTTSWTYDAFGRAVSETDPLAEERAFTFDGAGNLIRAVDRNGRVIDYRYDAANRQTHEYWYEDTGDAPALPTSVAGWDSNYTATNALRTFTYAYDDAGRLETAADSGEIGGAPANSYAYQYVDGSDRVAQSVFSLAGNPTFTLDYGYFKSGNRQEVKATLGTVSTHSESTHFVTSRIDPPDPGAGQRDDCFSRLRLLSFRRSRGFDPPCVSPGGGSFRRAG